MDFQELFDNNLFDNNNIAEEISEVRLMRRDTNAEDDRKVILLGLATLLLSFVLLGTIAAIVVMSTSISSIENLRTEMQRQQEDRQKEETHIKAHRQKWIGLLFDKLDESQLISILVSPFLDQDTMALIEERVMQKILNSPPSPELSRKAADADE